MGRASARRMTRPRLPISGCLTPAPSRKPLQGASRPSSWPSTRRNCEEGSNWLSAPSGLAQRQRNDARLGNRTYEASLAFG